MNLDRFAEGLLDIQGIPVVQHCRRCSDAIYYYRNFGICDDCESEEPLEYEEDEHSESEDD